MNTVTTHQRPGVYSAYDASSVIQGSANGRTVGIAAVSAGGDPGTLYTLTGREQAATAFGAEDGLTELTELLLRNGAGKVCAVPVAEAAGYAAAFELLAQTDGIAAVTCDSADVTVQQALRDSVKSAAENRRERIAVVCGGEGETVAQLVARAGELNSERVVLTAPGGARAAAAVAGSLAGESDPAIPLGGAELSGVTSLPVQYGEDDIDALVLGGVTPLEVVGGVVAVIRGVTTRTKTGESADSTWREITTVRVVDNVISAVRSALRSKFNRSKNTEQSREAIRSQTIVELERKVRDEIVTGYDAVGVSALESDPTVCLVEFSFTVAHGLNQIWLTAHITV